MSEHDLVAQELVLPLDRTPPPRRRIYLRTTGKPGTAIKIDPQEVTRPEQKQQRRVTSPVTGREELRDVILLPDRLAAVRISSARDYVFVEEEDIATVAGYVWRKRAINSWNGYYHGAQTWWEEEIPGDEPNIRYRMWLHDLLMDTPLWSPSAPYETDGVRWMVQHRDYNGMNCTRDNMRLVESSDGFVEVPKINLNCGVWWNYRKHRWSARAMPEGKWYVELGTFKTFEEAASAYFNTLFDWTPDKRATATYAWGTAIEYNGQTYAIEEWQQLREAERGAEPEAKEPRRKAMTAEEIEERMIRFAGGRGSA